MYKQRGLWIGPQHPIMVNEYKDKFKAQAMGPCQQ